MNSTYFTYNLENQKNFILGGENDGILYIPDFTNAAKENTNNAIYGGNANARFQDLAVPSFLYKHESIHLPKYNGNNDDISVLSDESFERLFDMISKQMKYKTNTTRNTRPTNDHRKTKKH
jgi:hypothetical protein